MTREVRPFCRRVVNSTLIGTTSERRPSLIPHLHLLSAQYLARALQPHHVNHAEVTADPGPRRMKQTLRSKCFPYIEQFVGASGTVAPVDYRRVLGEIHSKVVSDAKSSYPPNRVLGDAVPQINSEETALPRITRVTLSRLRSGHCSSLASFQHRIGAAPSDRNATLRLTQPTTSSAAPSIPPRFRCQTFGNDPGTWPSSFAAFPNLLPFPTLAFALPRKGERASARPGGHRTTHHNSCDCIYWVEYYYYYR